MCMLYSTLDMKVKTKGLKGIFQVEAKVLNVFVYLHHYAPNMYILVHKI